MSSEINKPLKPIFFLIIVLIIFFEQPDLLVKDIRDFATSL